MILRRFSVVFLAAVLAACSSNPNPPAVQDITVNKGKVDPGSIVTLSATYRMSAPKQHETRVSEAFSSVITLPVGATLVPHTTRILFQNERPADSQGTCADGRAWFLFNFQEGEFIDDLGYDPLVAVLSMDLVLQVEANKGLAIASADPAAPADPCGPLDGQSVTLTVKTK